jgi:Flp pilus assembly protein TadB
VTGEPASAGDRERTTAAPGRGHPRSVDIPAFWWSAAVVFLVNAALMAGDGRWLIALLQIVTAVWAAVAAVTAREQRMSGRDHPA